MSAARAGPMAGLLRGLATYASEHSNRSELGPKSVFLPGFRGCAARSPIDDAYLNGK